MAGTRPSLESMPEKDLVAGINSHTSFVDDLGKSGLPREGPPRTVSISFPNISFKAEY